MVWFWYFLIYSFLGFLVEVAYVRLVGGVKRDRKCRLVLPICPVYGLGALAILLLPPLVRDSLPLLFPAAALVCTAVEYVTGLFYEKVFRVSFWDYSHLPLNLGGRVCLLFALFWGVLALLVLHVIHPAAAWLAARIPLWAFPPAVLATALDTLLTARLLRRTGDPSQKPPSGRTERQSNLPPSTSPHQRGRRAGIGKGHNALQSVERIAGHRFPLPVGHHVFTVQRKVHILRCDKKGIEQLFHGPASISRRR